MWNGLLNQYSYMFFLHIHVVFYVPLMSRSLFWIYDSLQIKIIIIIWLFSTSSTAYISQMKVITHFRHALIDIYKFYITSIMNKWPLLQW